jgi:hypothetical protein
MKRAFWALSLSASALAAVLAAGCGKPTTNDEVVGAGSAPPSQGEAPSYKGYADFAKAQGEKTAKVAGKGKDASKGQAAGKGQ